MNLDRDRIVATALELLRAEGLDRLNMRALARRLGVQASALYWHVGGKDELIALMGLAFYRRAYAAAAGATDWRDWLRALGHEFRAALLDCPDSARLCVLARPPEQDAARAGDELAAPLVALGLDRAQALAYQGSVLAFTLGWVVYEQSEALHDHLSALFSFEQSHHDGLEAMIRGLAD